MVKSTSGLVESSWREKCLKRHRHESLSLLWLTAPDPLPTAVASPTHPQRQAAPLLLSLLCQPEKEFPAPFQGSRQGAEAQAYCLVCDRYLCMNGVIRPLSSCSWTLVKRGWGQFTAHWYNPRACRQDTLFAIFWGSLYSAGFWYKNFLFLLPLTTLPLEKVLVTFIYILLFLMGRNIK